MVAAGAVEGAVLGTAQALVLRSYLPALELRAWVGRTALGAVIAWAIGMTPNTLLDAGVEQGKSMNRHQEPASLGWE